MTDFICYLENGLNLNKQKKLINIYLLFGLFFFLVEGILFYTLNSVIAS